MSFEDFLEAFWARHPDWGGPVKSGVVDVLPLKPAETPTKSNPGAPGGVLALGSDARLDPVPDLDGIEPEGLDSGHEVAGGDYSGIEESDEPETEWWNR